MFDLRGYQRAAVDDGLRCWQEGQSALIVAPTGSGKTVMLAELVRCLIGGGFDRSVQVVIGCHKREILRQIKHSLEWHIEEVGRSMPLEVVKAGAREIWWDAPLLLAMIPTLSRRRQRIPRAKRVVLLDEAHHLHSGAGSWQSTVQALAPTWLGGFTATPIRPNGRGLGEPWQGLIEAPSVRELIEMGHLSPYAYFAGEDVIDTTGLPCLGGDFVIDGMEDRALQIHGSVVPTWRRFNPAGLRTITACTSVRHAQEVAELYRQEGVPAAAVHGSMGDAERDGILGAFAAGTVTVLATCALIEEGFDLPSCACLQWLRPTKSRRLFLQLSGRVLRPEPGKEAVIIDQAGNHRLGLPCDPVEWSLSPDVEAAPRSQDLGRLVRGGDGQVRRVQYQEEARFQRLQPAQCGMESVSIEHPQHRPPPLLEQLAANPEAVRQRLLSGAVRPSSLIRQLEDHGALVPLQAWEQLGQALQFHPWWAHRKRIEAVQRAVAANPALTKRCRPLWRAIAPDRIPRGQTPGKVRLLGVVESPDGSPVMVLRASVDPLVVVGQQAAWREAIEGELGAALKPSGLTVEVAGLLRPHRRTPLMRRFPSVAA